MTPDHGAAEPDWRRWAPEVLAALLRRTGDFGAAEDAVQEALLAASERWPVDGAPGDPKGWLVTVAWRRLVDRWRADSARSGRELALAARQPRDRSVVPGADEPSADEDDSLALLLLCCHPELTRASQVALTLRAVGGLSTAQIARAFLVPEATMAQRISRAKSRLREVGARFLVPSADQLVDRVVTVAHVLYVIFTEGHTATTGTTLIDTSLADEAIRITRQLHDRLPSVPEVSGLLALMLLTDARRTARLDERGSLVPLAEQDRSRWDRRKIDEGIRLLEAALPVGPVGPYQLQAAIAAVHAEAPDAARTDWPQVVALYDMLERLAPGAMVTLGRAVAVAEVDGPAAGMRLVEPLLDDPALRRNHRLPAVRGHLLERAGDHLGAAEAYADAARLATSVPEQRYLNARAARLAGE